MNRWVDLDSGAAIGQVAQLVEQGTENPRVGGSIPPLAIRSQRVSTSSHWARVSEPVWGRRQCVDCPGFVPFRHKRGKLRCAVTKIGLCNDRVATIDRLGRRFRVCHRAGYSEDVSSWGVDAFNTHKLTEIGTRLSLGAVPRVEVLALTIKSPGMP